MKALIVGGTGTISTSVVAEALRQGWQITLLNRGSRPAPQGVEQLVVDIHHEEQTRQALGDSRYDVVVDFIAFEPQDVARDVRLFAGRTAQNVFISSA